MMGIATLNPSYRLFSNKVAWTLLPLQGGGWEGDGEYEETSAFRPHPHPSLPLEREGG